MLHIGDSHVQADYFSGQVRKRLQAHFGNAGRGLIFPYRMANSWGPIDFGFAYSGLWQYSSIVKPGGAGNIGYSGFAVSTVQNGTVEIRVRKKNENLEFSQVRILGNNTSFLPQYSKTNFSAYKLDHSTVIDFEGLEDSVVLRPLLSSKPVDLGGFVLTNGQPGLLYHAIGINGASTLHFERSEYKGQEASELRPDLIIVSLGTNDAYVPPSSFCSSCIYGRYLQLIRSIKASNPGVSLLLTVPPDHYYQRNYPSKNLNQIIDIIYEVGSEENTAIWDLYRLMGGAGSIAEWRHMGLAQRDLVHFTEEGYTLQGDWLFEALMHHYQVE